MLKAPARKSSTFTQWRCDIKPLLERLRATEQRERGGARWPINPDGREAAARIEALTKALLSIQTANNSYAAGEATRTINSLIEEALNER